jgi:SAM-dependent methyltransferase
MTQPVRTDESAGDWRSDALLDAWPSGPDATFFHQRVHEVTTSIAAAGAAGRILEVGCGDAVCSERLSAMGFACFALEPSASMIATAGERLKQRGCRVVMVRAVAEHAPFRNRSFDRVLSDASIDHMGDPQRAIAEMARLLQADGRLIIGVVNYGGLGIRCSRVLYRLGRAAGWIGPERRLFWDSPVPYEHTFECTYARLVDLCESHLRLEHVRGISIGFGFPGWGTCLSLLPRPVAGVLVRCLDGLAHRLPWIADYIVSVWKLKIDG